MKLFSFLFFFLFIYSNLSISQDVLDNESDKEFDTDFASPYKEKIDDTEDVCELSKDSDLLDLLNFKLKKFNPMSKELEGQPQLSAEEIEQKSIRFYAEQLKTVKPVKIEIETFTSLGGNTLASLINRSSRIFLKHPEKCEFFSLYGDQIIGQFQISYETILRLYASAVNKSNKIAQDFIRSQIVPSPMSLDTAINSLYDDYGYQQNVIESLLPQEVRTLFWRKLNG